MGPWAGLDRCGKSSPPHGIRSPESVARSESLYRQNYPGPRDLDNYSLCAVKPLAIILVRFVPCNTTH